MLWMRGEKEKIKQVLEAGSKYGYGNLIQWLQTKWMLSLMENYDMSPECVQDAVKIGPPEIGEVDNKKALKKLKEKIEMLED